MSANSVKIEGVTKSESSTDVDSSRTQTDSDNVIQHLMHSSSNEVFRDFVS